MAWPQATLDPAGQSCPSPLSPFVRTGVGQEGGWQLFRSSQGAQLLGCRGPVTQSMTEYLVIWGPTYLSGAAAQGHEKVLREVKVAGAGDPGWLAMEPHP